MQWRYFFRPVFGHYTDFTSRTSRKGFWLFWLWCLVLGWWLLVLETWVDLVIVTATPDMVVGLLSFPFGLALFVPSWAIQVRPLHDISRSAWALLWWGVPVLGWLLLLVFFCSPGTLMENRYGPSRSPSWSERP